MRAWRRLLCAATLAAGAAAGQEDGDGIGAEAVSERVEEPRATALGASVQLSASARGGHELQLIAHVRRSGVRITAGAESFSGPSAPQRHGLLLGGEVELGDDAAIQIEVHAIPAQEQMSRAAGEAWLRIGWAGAGVLARRTSLGAQRLDALGAGVSLSAEILGVESELRVVAWRVDLASSRSRDPWNAFGQRTLDWPERWQAELSARRPVGRIAVTAVAGMSQSPLPQLFARAGAGLELRIGPALLSAAVACARTSDGVAQEIAAGVAVGELP
jgi:hypothetical protein